MKIPSNKVVYFHWRKGFNATFAFRAIPYTDETKEIEVEAAFCAKKDPFNKKRGRLIATGRLAQYPSVLNVEGCTSYEQVISRVLEDWFQNDALPRHVAKALRDGIPRWPELADGFTI